jgi:energy-coupling factor transporter ATP-binding protein EcfA2
MTPNPHTTYLTDVFPRVPDDVTARTLDCYPDVRLTPTDRFTPLAQIPVLMLVGLTGTGKSTTLKALQAISDQPTMTAIPSRRDLADLILIPTAQHINGDPITPVKDREQRFAYTRLFREQVAEGGTAAAFTWLHLRVSDQQILSEGVRGPNEIGYALSHTKWRIAELWVDPVTRLRRLSDRTDAFDTIANLDISDLSFLPESRHDEVRTAVMAGEISPTAIATARAEALNYGADPYDETNTTPNYHCFHIDTMTPDEVAAAVWDFVLV